MVGELWSWGVAEALLSVLSLEFFVQMGGYEYVHAAGVSVEVNVNIRGYLSHIYIESGKSLGRVT